MKTIRKLVLINILIISLAGISLCQQTISMNSTVRMGVSQINITPEKPVTMSGYDNRKTPFTGIHDELYASALFFSKEKTKALIITTDLIGFSFGFIDDIKLRISSATGIPADNIMITAVHNHGGPAVSTYEDSLSAANEQYIVVLKEKLVSMAKKAAENPVPFKTGIGKGTSDLRSGQRF